LEAANVWQTSEVAFASANEADGSDMQKQQKLESKHADGGKRTVPSGANPIHNKHPKHPPSPSSSPMRPMIPRSIGSPSPSQWSNRLPPTTLHGLVGEMRFQCVLFHIDLIMYLDVLGVCLTWRNKSLIIY
jgi:hypothetical protein